MLTFVGGKEAEVMFKSTFQSENFSSFKGAYPGVRTRQYLLEVTSWASASKTAKAVLSAVHDAREEVFVVGMKGGFQAFSNDEPTAKGEKVPVIFVDLDAKLGLRVRNAHNASEEPNMIGAKVEFSNYIAFLHELGHAKQWIENPVFFIAPPMATTRFAADIRQAAIGRMTRGDTNAPKREGTGWQAQAKFNKALTNYVSSHPVFGGIRNPDPKGWGVRVESDNIFRHERPICEELRLPQRLNYRDLVIS